MSWLDRRHGSRAGEIHAATEGRLGFEVEFVVLVFNFDRPSEGACFLCNHDGSAILSKQPSSGKHSVLFDLERLFWKADGAAFGEP